MPAADCIRQTVLGHDLTLGTADFCFSPRRVDAGTLAMLSAVTITPGQKILDLGCGYGAVGIVCAKIAGDQNVTMCDIDPRVIELARRNADANGVPGVTVVQSDAFDAIEGGGFDLILCNPPYQADFSVPKRLIEQSRRQLTAGGNLWMVTKRREWYKRKLIAVYGGVAIQEIDGYHVFRAERRT